METYKIIRGAVAQPVLDLVHTSLQMMKNNQYFTNNVPLTDRSYFSGLDPVEFNCWSCYAPVVTESLLTVLRDQVAEASGLDVVPTYSYARIYWHGAEMVRHKDRPSCEISATLNISIDPEPWAIYMAGEPVLLYPGDMCVYPGPEIEHWREPYQGREQVQVFLHYVDQAGANSNLAWDGRPQLGLKPAKIFR
jgi:hypothetical protein